MKAFACYPIVSRTVSSVVNEILTQTYFNAKGSALLNIIVALLMLVALTLLSACDSSDVSVRGGTPKNIPKNVTITTGTRAIGLDWSGVSGASGYSVYWANKPGVSKTQGTVIHTTIPHLEHRDLANGQTYYYVITAYTGNSESRESEEVSAAPKVAPPTSPSFLSVRGGDARVTLRWSPIRGANHYSLYWNTHGDVSHSDARIDHVVSPFVHSDLSNNQTYYYILVAENAAGPSSASPEMNAQPQMPAPSAPIIEQLSNAAGQATLHWRNVSNASRYTLYWNTSGNVSTEDTAIEQVTNPYTVAPLRDDTSYYYRVQAHNAGGDSPLSNEAQASSPDNNIVIPPGAVPDKPVDMKVSLGNGQLNLDWPTIDGAIGYNLYWSTKATGEIIPGTTGVEKLSHLQAPYTHIGLNNGGTYRYRLSAFNHQGESDLSDAISGKPQMIIPGVPAGVHAISGDERIAVRWNDVQGASGYTLYLDDQQGHVEAIPNVNSPYEAKGLRNKLSYQIEVTAHNAQSESGRSTAITATPHEPVPNAPQRLSAQPGNGQVIVQWDSALAQNPNDSDQNIRGYHVYYDNRDSDSRSENPVNRTLLDEQDSNVDISQIDDNRWQLTHTGLKNSQRYYYAVTALNDGGESRVSSTVWARPEVAIPGAPSHVWAEAGDNQVVIHFTKADSRADTSAIPIYNLYWRKQQTDGQRNTTVISNIEPKYRFSEGPDTNGNTYDFQVSAFSDGGESVLSRVVSASPQVLPPAQPPQDFQVSAQPGQVTLSWSPVSDASEYILYWSIDSEIDPSTSARLSGIEVQPGFQHTGLVNGERYYYQIAAVNPGGESTLSQTVITKPQVYPPSTPNAPNLSADDASVIIDFTGVDDASSYTLYWHTDPGVDPGLWSQKHGIQSGDRLESLTNGQAYYFKLAANNAGGQSAPSATSSAGPQAPLPLTPSGISAIAGDGRVSLNWHSKPHVSYTLYWSDNANVVPINSGNLIDKVRPSYIHTGLRNNTVYTYQLTASNTRGDSPASAMITVTPNTQDPNPVNPAPIISLTAPNDGQQFEQGSLVTVAATANDDLQVNRVEFLVDGVEVGRDFSAPYSLTFLIALPDVGNDVELRAVVVDSAGNRTESSPVSVGVVADTTVPTVTVITPASAASYTEGTSIVVEASSSDNIGLDRIEFSINGAEVFATDSIAPFSATYTVPSNFADAGPAPLTLVVTAFDHVGNPASDDVTVTIVPDEPPTVSLTAPAPGSEIGGGTAVALTADASDDLGVVQVEFLIDGVSVGVDTLAPYALRALLPDRPSAIL